VPDDFGAPLLSLQLFFYTFGIVKQTIAIIAMFVAAFVPPYFVSHKEQSQEPLSEQVVEQPTKRMRLVVAGDLMMHTPQLTAARLNSGDYDFTSSFRYVAHYFRDADLAVVNLETTLSREGGYSGYPCFCSPAEVAYAMRYMGIDVALLANNHCLDRGAVGVRRTADILDECDIERMGVFRDSTDYSRNNIKYLTRGGVRLAMLNYTYGTNGIPTPKGVVVNQLDTVTMKRDLHSISPDSVDCVVAFVHWGNEYERRPNRNQRKLAEWMKCHGVDIIIGSHPHVVQPMEMDSLGRVTLFSLGNFVSNQRTRYRDGGLIATIDVEIVDSILLNESFSQRKSLNVTLEPVWVHLPDYAVMPREVGDTIPMSADSRRRYDRFMQDISDHIGI
jgi:poly-gamma-glutamate synthesis protein (capsule biosynthesis protein)